LDVSTQNNKKLLNLERWHQLLKNGDDYAVKEEMSSLQNAINDIQEVLRYLNNYKYK